MNYKEVTIIAVVIVVITGIVYCALNHMNNPIVKNRIIVESADGPEMQKAVKVIYDDMRQKGEIK